MKRQRLFYITGVVTALIGIGILLQIPYFYLHSKYMGEQSVNNFDKTLTPNKESRDLTQNSPSKSNSNVQKDHSKLANVNSLGKIEIPSLSLIAPIVEGTDDDKLSSAVGHLSTSVLPGKKGLSVLAAHNATWFRHVDQLKTGDDINIITHYGTFTFRVTRSAIVKVGTNINNTNTSSIVLESCYPLDAWYLTNYRFLVYGDLIQNT